MNLAWHPSEIQTPCLTGTIQPRLFIYTVLSFIPAKGNKNILSLQCTNARRQVINCSSSMALLWDVFNRKHIGRCLCLWYLLASGQTLQKRGSTCRRPLPYCWARFRYGKWAEVLPKFRSLTFPYLKYRASKKVNASHRVERPCGRLKLIYPSLIKLSSGHHRLL